MPDPCPPVCPGAATPPPEPAGPAPEEGSAAYDALVVEPGPGELARLGNDRDAELTGGRLDVVVPAGSRLVTRLVCAGRTAVTVTTSPPSDAEAELACGSAEPTELIVEQSQPVPGDTAYRVRVEAPAPARWYVVLSAAAS